MITVELTLTKAARSKGGDRYDGTTDDDDRINIYVPQSISRANGAIAERINLTIESK